VTYSLRMQRWLEFLSCHPTCGNLSRFGPAEALLLRLTPGAKEPLIFSFSDQSLPDFQVSFERWLAALDLPSYYSLQCCLARTYFVPRTQSRVGEAEIEDLIVAMAAWVMNQEQTQWEEAYARFSDAFPPEDEAPIGYYPSGWSGEDYEHLMECGDPGSMPPVPRTTAATLQAMQLDPAGLDVCLVHAVSGLAILGPEGLQDAALERPPVLPPLPKFRFEEVDSDYSEFGEDIASFVLKDWEFRDSGGEAAPKPTD